MGFTAETTDQAQISLPRHDLLPRPSTQRRHEEWEDETDEHQINVRSINYDKVSYFTTIYMTNYEK